MARGQASRERGIDALLVLYLWMCSTARMLGLLILIYDWHEVAFYVPGSLLG